MLPPSWLSSSAMFSFVSSMLFLFLIPLQLYLVSRALKVLIETDSFDRTTQEL